MCRFKKDAADRLNSAFRFQYILCVGSSCYTTKWIFYFRVSIHPMCRFKLKLLKMWGICFRFNTSYVSVQDSNGHPMEVEILFQYILCVGSRLLKGIKE